MANGTNPTMTTLWEAFAGGKRWGENDYGELQPGADYTERTSDFWEQVIEPKMGISGEGYYPPAFDPFKLERGEKDFRMSIGDPYTQEGGIDPFRWENLSRMSQAERQLLLENQSLYAGKGALGGKYGEIYETGLLKVEEGYGTSLTEERESLTHGSLLSDVALQSGTSGAVLKSGSAITQSEDILSEAYKKAKTLGGEYMLGREETVESLQGNLSEALTTYMNVLDEEKNTWYQDIKDKIVEVKGQEGWEVTLEEYANYEAEDVWTTGAPLAGDEDWETREAACGIGELYDVASGLCQPYLEEEWTEPPAPEWRQNEEIDFEYPPPSYPSEGTLLPPGDVTIQPGGDRFGGDPVFSSGPPTQASTGGGGWWGNLGSNVGNRMSNIFGSASEFQSAASRSPFGRRRRRGRRRRGAF